MAESDSIQIPVSLIVDSVRMDNKVVDDMTDHLDSATHTVVRDANQVLGGIDPSKMTEKMTKNFDTVIKKVTDLNQALRNYDLAQKKAGQSSNVYRERSRENTVAIEREERAYAQYLSMVTDDRIGRSAWQAFQIYGPGNNPTAGDNQYRELNERYQQIERETQRHNEEMRRLTEQTPNPLDFISSGSDTAINTMLRAYETVLETVNSLSTAESNFKQSTVDGTFTQEYNERIETIQKLMQKLDQLSDKSKKMEQLGASDNSWESLRYDMEALSKTLTGLIKDSKELAKNGTAFQLGPDAAKTKEQIALLETLRKRVTALRQAMNKRADKNETPYTEDYKKRLAEIEAVRREVEKLQAKKQKCRPLVLTVTTGNS